MTFSTLALIAVIGLLGPILAMKQSWHLPVILGELIGGIIFGATGFGVLHASDEIFTFLADIGFALTMFVAGTHVPVRDPAVRGALRNGVGRAVLAGIGAAVLGVACPR